MAERPAVIGVDVGGTFTDFVLLDHGDGALATIKVPSTPGDPAEAVLAGLRELAGARLAVERVVHGTTVATNALIERGGARVALVTTAGFKDLIEIGRGMRLIPGTLFDRRFVRPQPLVSRPLRFEVCERTVHTGEILSPVDPAEVSNLAGRLRELGVEAVAVCFLHSYANPTNELRVKELLGYALPGVAVCTSVEILAEHREYERFSTAVMNAHLLPMMSRYLTDLQERVREVVGPANVYVMSSSGGVMTAETAARMPVRTIFSGPAGGVLGAVFVARHLGVADFISYDMGGTSTDVSLVRGCSPTTRFESQAIRGIPLRVPQLEISTVGAGGGSIAWADFGGVLKVGPQSAGAEPGPASYCRGGTAATLTDANLLLGRLDPSHRLGDRLALDLEAAHRAIRDLGRDLGGADPYRIAAAIVDIAVAHMVSAVREISVEKGYDPRDFVLIAFGGAGPLHAAMVAAELEMDRVVVPRRPGNLSALGLLTCDLRNDFAATHIARLSTVDPADIEGRLDRLETEARSSLAAEGFRGQVYVGRSLDMRYVGQMWELNVPVDGGLASKEVLQDRFHEAHATAYGHSNPGAAVEIVALRVSVFGQVEKPAWVAPAGADRPSGKDAMVGTRPVHFGGAFSEFRVYQRDLLAPGQVVEGPAVLHEGGSTTLVPAGWLARVSELGHLLLSRGAS